ncbi:hypothetical protein P3T37_004301 [Kitasatospora sp. MAA4]|uniref:hypothetical protein n=1 Tax=Kitasatospora sp. MAA4 TaxID=3035093 RepID=UPI00247679BE|nr:hypothetical protein [Kitasatospora sp. MAA4]MDH6134892.1 hypothetical protein [Kitasatospora sp. MAA4]
MDAMRVSELTEQLTFDSGAPVGGRLGGPSAGSGLLAATRAFAGALRGSVTRRSARGLLLVGTPQHEPWHLAAHLRDEASWSGAPLLAPALVRHEVPAGAPAHLRHDLRRLAQARRGETVLVVTPVAADAVLLDRVQDARRAGATVLALEAGDPELSALAHESLTVDSPDEPGFDLVQHLVSAAAGERRRAGSRLSRLLATFSTEPVNRW